MSETAIIERLSPEGLSTRDRDEIDVQVATAQKFPRDLALFESGVLAAIQNPEFANTCTYALVRGGKTIIGPSIRFAECVRMNFKHLAIGTRIVGEEEKHIVIEVRGIDFQTNNRDQAEVRRRIIDRDGNRYNDDMIVTTQMAAQAIGRRNLILSLTSKALWGPLWEEAKRVAGGKPTPKTPEDKAEVVAKRTKALEFLHERWQITEEQVLKILKVEKITEIGADQIVILRGLATALQDGEITVDQALRGSKPIPSMPKPKRGKKAKTYRAPKGASAAAAKAQSGTAPTAQAKGPITTDQYRDLMIWLGEHGMDATDAAKAARSLGHIGSLKELPAALFPKLFGMLEKGGGRS